MAVHDRIAETAPSPAVIVALALRSIMSVVSLFAARPAWLLGERDFRRLWVVGLVVFAVRWLEMLAVAVFAYQRPARRSSWRC
jgi:hypothetical protein